MVNTLFTIQKVKKIPAKGALVYFLIGVVWIFFMSVLLPRARPELHYPHWIEVMSYWIFVIFSTSGIFLVIQHYLNRSILTQEEVEVSKDRFRLIAEKAQDIIFRYRLSPSKQMDYISPAIAAISGYSPEVFYNNPLQIFKLIHPEDSNRFHNILNSVELLSEPHILRWMAKNGETLYLEHRTTPIHQDGKIVVIEGIARDVTREKKLESTRLRLAAIVESAEDAIIGKDLDAQITDWNSGAELLYGYTKEEAVGKPITILLPPNSAEEIDAIMAKVKRGERIVPYETVRVTKSGDYINVLLTVSPIKDQNDKIIGAAVIARDITYQNKIETERCRQVKIKAYQDLSKKISQHLGANYELIQKYGHETLNNIYDYETRDALNRILNATINGKSMSNHLLAYAMPKSVKMGYFSLPEFCLQLHELAELLLPENLNISSDIMKSNTNVIADIYQLQNISLGICSYLNKLLIDGGKIFIGINSPSDSIIRIHGKSEDIEYIALNISSPEILLDQNEIDNLWNPLNTSKDASLEINQAIVVAYPVLERIGGWFDIYRQNDQGTVFSMVLPVADSTDNNYPIIKVNMGAGVGVLLVDEDDDIRKRIKTLLTNQGFSVFTAKTGDQGLEKFKEESNTIELIYSDLGVANLSGVELAQEIKCINPNVHFIGATRFGEMRETDTDYLSDFYTVLQKPFMEQQLLDALLKARWSHEVVSRRLI